MLSSLSSTDIAVFRENGFVVLKSFYDVEKDLRPIQRGIHSIIGLVIHKHQLSIQQASFSAEYFDSGYQELIAKDRRFGGEVYDAVKQLPAFMRLMADPRHEAITRDLRETDLAGIAAAGYGIRIDNPNEERFRANWHQEYLGQLRSLDGVGLWIPLQRVDETMGAVEYCVGSHRSGLLKVRSTDPKNPDKTGAYGLSLDNEEAVVSGFARSAPETNLGDLVILDFLVIHRSGFNRSERARWSMQTRYFNFRDPTGIRIGWCGSYATGKNVADVHPELFVSDAEANRG